MRPQDDPVGVRVSAVDRARPIQRDGSLGTGSAVVVAAAVWLAALHPTSWAWSAGAAVSALGVWWRRVVVFGLGVVVWSSAAAGAAHRGLDVDVSGPIVGSARLVSDPRVFGPGTRADADVDGHRWELRAHGAAAWQLSGLAAGDVIDLTGTARPSNRWDRRWHRPRHVVGTVVVERVGARRRGSVLSTLANTVRRTLERGAEAAGLSSRDRALFLGLTVGDDRGQSDEVRQHFLASGLTHLLAVSGSNVAFVLIVLGPLLRRGGLRWRLVATAVALVVFGTITRWEPSVTRAVIMAALATAAQTLGRPVSGLRLLALAVIGLVLMDPLLVHRVGFMLSVGASAGIAVLAGPLAGRLPGPRMVREPLAVTVAAQVGVAPVQIPVFGSMPLASVPANLLAGPVAGLAMVWGMVAGTIAGIVPTLAPVLHLPTRWCTAWLAAVARVAAGVG